MPFVDLSSTKFEARSYSRFSSLRLSVRKYYFLTFGRPSLLHDDDLSTSFINPPLSSAGASACDSRRRLLFVVFANSTRAEVPGGIFRQV